MSIGNNKQESFLPTLSDDIISEFGEKNGRFNKVEFDGDDVYVERNKIGSFYPESRFLIFPKLVVSVEALDLERLFDINDIEFFEQIRAGIDTARENAKGELINVIKIENAVYTSRYYRSTNISDRQDAVKALRNRNFRDI